MPPEIERLGYSPHIRTRFHKKSCGESAKEYKALTLLTKKAQAICVLGGELLVGLDISDIQIQVLSEFLV